MRYGILAPNVPANFPWSEVFNSVGLYVGCSPCLLAAHAYVETLEIYGADEARTCVSYDGGHGLMQLTSSFPPDWQNAQTNIGYAANQFIIPALETWYHDYGYTGDTLVRCEAATYNAGLNAALRGHFKGDVGMYTTKSEGMSYDVRVLAAYKTLASGAIPPLPAVIG